MSQTTGLTVSKYVAVLIITLATSVTFCYGEVTTVAEFPFALYEGILKSYVDAKGLVDYKGLHADRQVLDDVANSLAELDPPVFEQWKPTEQMVFWINAYNGLMLKAVVDHFPLKNSLQDSGRAPGNNIRQLYGVWDQLRYKVVKLPTTLETIDVDFLRSRYNEPRILMALVSAALGSPPLRNEPYMASRIEEQLEDQTKRFLSDPTKFRIDRKTSTVYLSSLFNWNGPEFVKTYRPAKLFPNKGDVESSVLNFIGKYLPRADREYLQKGEYSIKYVDFDWSLNQQK
jgi:hypothetical protein